MSEPMSEQIIQSRREGGSECKWMQGRAPMIDCVGEWMRKASEWMIEIRGREGIRVNKREECSHRSNEWLKEGWTSFDWII